MSTILAIDPGPTESAWVLYDSNKKSITRKGKQANKDLLIDLSIHKGQGGGIDLLVVEMIASYGKPVGQEVFETCVWIGRFFQAAEIPVYRLFRKDVKMHLCGTVNGVNDAVIRQRLIDLYGGKEKAIGNKSTHGPLYCIKADEWQALALAITWAETHKDIQCSGEN